MPQITFTVNEQTLEALDQLKQDFNVDSRAAVLRRMLALAKVATTNAGADHTLTIVDKEGDQQKIMLQG